MDTAEYNVTAVNTIICVQYDENIFCHRKIYASSRVYQIVFSLDFLQSLSNFDIVRRTDIDVIVVGETTS